MNRTKILNKPFLILIISIMIHGVSNAQWDEDFTSNQLGITWIGDTANYQIINNELHLVAPPEADTSILVRESTSIIDAIWEFTITMEFNPSANNLARIYLVSDNLNLTVAKGYYVQVGGSNDDITLVKTSGTTQEIVVDGIDDRVDLSSFSIAIKVTRDAIGNWQLFSDLELDLIYEFEGESFDDTYIASSFFGLMCKYTSTRSDKFSFDNFSTSGSPFVDLTAPVVDTVFNKDSTHIVIQFSEPLEPSSATENANYSLNHGYGNPVNVIFNSISKREVELEFPKFQNSLEYALTIENIQDTIFNTMESLSFNFFLFYNEKSNYHDVLINELFPDPSPPEDLPEVEFVEVVNMTDKYFQMSEFYISDANTIGSLENYHMEPFSIVILCPLNSKEFFSEYGNVVGVSPWPSLNNSSDKIQLVNSDSVMLDSVSYDVSWYGDQSKQGGGWTLEKKYPRLVCEGKENWTASISNSGGTPGIQNSVFESEPNLKGPILEEAILQNEKDLLLIFDERVFPETLVISTEPPLKFGTGREAPGFQNQVLVTAIDEFASNIIYQIKVDQVYNCYNQNIKEGNNTASALLISPVDSGYVLLSEILFNPKSGGADFLELFNNSMNYVDLNNWQVSNSSDPNDFEEIVNSRRILQPFDFIVLTEDQDALLFDYPNALLDKVLVVKDLPSFPDKSGTVLLINPESMIQDSLTYYESWHNPFLDDKEGVSLERLSYQMTGWNSNNWKSSSTTKISATPGFKNSHLLEDFSSQNLLEIEPLIFIPDNSGTNDYVTIKINIENLGYAATLFILDRYGQKVKTITERAIIPASGFFTWDGTSDSNKKMKMGPYVIILELLSPNGDYSLLRERVIIGSKFN